MGLYGASTGVVAGTASTFAFSDSSMDAWAVAYLFSDSTNSIAKIVHDAQGAYVDYLKPSLEQPTYADTVAFLTGYEQYCRPAGIRSLISDALSKSKAVAEQPGDSAATAVVAQLGGVLGRPVSESDAITLYAWYANKDKRADIKAHSDLIKGLAPTANDEAVLQGKLGPAFVPIGIKGNVLGQRWAAAAATLADIDGGNAKNTKSVPQQQPTITFKAQ